MLVQHKAYPGTRSWCRPGAPARLSTSVGRLPCLEEVHKRQHRHQGSVAQQRSRMVVAQLLQGLHGQEGAGLGQRFW